MKFAVLRCLCCISLLVSPLVHSADANLQDYLFFACQSAQGALQQRCQETDQGLGNVSGDSESSLNPTQTLAAGELEWRQSLSDDDASQSSIDLGGWAVSIQGYAGGLEREPYKGSTSRSYDVDLSGVSLWASRTLGSAGVVQFGLEKTKREGVFGTESPGRNFEPWVNAGELDYDSLGFSLLYSHAFSDNWNVDVGVGRLNQDIELSRRSVFQESNRVIGQVNSFTVGVFEADVDWWGLSTAYEFAFGSFKLTPEASWTARSKTVDAYTERDVSGTGLNMRFSKTSSDSDLTSFGLSGVWTLNRESGVYLPHIRLMKISESFSSKAPIRVQYAQASDSAVLLIEKDQMGKDMTKLALGISAVHPMGWSWFADYAEILDNDHVSGWQFSAGLRKEL
jgi:hypothetical protein